MIEPSEPKGKPVSRTKSTAESLRIVDISASPGAWDYDIIEDLKSNARDYQSSGNEVYNVSCHSMPPSIFHDIESLRQEVKRRTHLRFMPSINQTLNACLLNGALYLEDHHSIKSFIEMREFIALSEKVKDTPRPLHRVLNSIFEKWLTPLDGKRKNWKISTLEIEVKDRWPIETEIINPGTKVSGLFSQLQDTTVPSVICLMITLSNCETTHKENKEIYRTTVRDYIHEAEIRGRMAKATLREFNLLEKIRLVSINNE